MTGLRNDDGRSSIDTATKSYKQQEETIKKMATGKVAIGV